MYFKEINFRRVCGFWQKLIPLRHIKSHLFINHQHVKKPYKKKRFVTYSETSCLVLPLPFSTSRWRSSSAIRPPFFAFVARQTSVI